MSELLPPKQRTPKDDQFPVRQRLKNITKKILDYSYYRQSATHFLGKAILVNNIPHIPPTESNIATGIFTLLGIVSGFEESIGLSRIHQIGNHVSTHTAGYHGLKGKTLSDGTNISPGSKVAVIDIITNMPKIKEKDNVIAITRKLYRSVTEEIQELAVRCQKNDPLFEGVQAFYGITHLAGPLAERLGFDVMTTRDPFKKFIPNIVRTLITVGHTKNKSWRRMNRNTKEIYEVFISKQKLIELHGQQDITNQKTRR